MRLDLYQNLNSDKVLAAIGLTANDCKRFRGAGVENGEIIIHCRTGGGNREDYPNKRLVNNKYYLRDEDDDFDSTYASYYFSIPDELKAEIEATEDKEAKAILGDAPTAIGIMFGDKKAIEQAQKNLDELNQ